MLSMALAVSFWMKAAGNVEALPFACGVMNILWSQGRPESGVNANIQQGTLSCYHSLVRFQSIEHFKCDTPAFGAHWSDEKLFDSSKVIFSVN